jgi:arylsulfatase A-like enzyme
MPFCGVGGVLCGAEGGVRSCSFIYSSLLKHPGTTHHGLFHAVDWLPTLTKLVGVPTTKNLPLDGVDIWSAIQSGDPTASPVREIPVEIAACGTDGAKSIVDGPQAALIVGDLKIIVDCFWRSTQQNETAQVYNITADAAEMHDLAASRPELVTPLLDRLAYWEAQSVVPYSEVMDLEKCGQGKPQGTNPPHWDFWC